MDFVKNYVKSVWRYFVGFAFLFIYLEIALRLVIDGAIKGNNLFFLFFVPSLSFFFSIFCSFQTNHTLKNSSDYKIANKIVFCFLSFLITLYFLIQLVYFRVFGSLFSFSFVKMGGEAAGNFSGATLLYIKKSFWQILAMLLPLLSFIVLACLDEKFLSGKVFGSAKRSEDCAIWKKCIFHGITLVLCVVFWFLAVLSIRCFGNQRGSAFYTYKSSSTDTDTSAERLGAFTTSVIEGRIYFFGNTEKSKKSKPASNKNPRKERSVSSDNEKETVENSNLIDFISLSQNSDDERVKDLCYYFASKPVHQKNSCSGLCKDYNVIYICAESFASYSMDERVTPLLCKMSRNGVVLKNYYNSYRNVTTNGEFAFATSIWPDVSRNVGDGSDAGTFSRSSKNEMPFGLGTMFSKNGYKTFAYHNYISSYYKRNESWKNLGFETMKFRGEGFSFENIWCPSDYELVRQCASDLISSDKPFLMYWMTFSGHGPYTSETYLYQKYADIVREKLNEAKENYQGRVSHADDYSTTEISYLCASYDLELSLQYLCDRLAEKGQLNKTLFVITGDHIPYMLSSEEQRHLAQLQNLPYDSVLGAYKNTAIIYSAGIKNPIQCENFCCNVDLLPTVLNLLGFDLDYRAFFGTDILGSGLHRARIYNGNFITDKVMYRRSDSTAIWFDSAKNMSDDEKEYYLENLINYTEAEYEMSLALIETDFWKKIGLQEKNSGNPTK